MRTFGTLLAASTLLAGCAGVAPVTSGKATPNRGAIVIAARIITPNGRAYSGGMTLNLQGIGEGSTESYRIFLPAKETLLYQIAPGLYRVEAPLGFFGNSKTILPIKADGESYSPQFPHDLLNFPPIEIKPEHTIALGELNVSIMPVPTGTPPNINIKFNHDVVVKRHLIETIIRSMADPNISEDKRKSYQSWTNSLQEALTAITSASNDSFEKPEPQE